ncbi:selenium cofactor biosynthesis protein YqeC [Thermodesulfobacteriota bacterium B35]
MARLDRILLRPGARSVAITGAGGKTSLMFLLARYLRQGGKRVIISTTTRIRRPQAGQGGQLCLTDAAGAADHLARALASRGLVTLARRLLPDSKLAGIDPDELAEIVRNSGADHLLVEADGARGRSLKAPAGHEPVIPAWAEYCIIVAGMDCIGERLGPDRVFRPELVAARTGMAMGEMITPETVARLVLHPQGLLKGCPETARTCVLLNKIDVNGGRDRARQVVSAAAGLAGRRPDCWISGTVQGNYGCTLS